LRLVRVLLVLADADADAEVVVAVDVPRDADLVVPAGGSGIAADLRLRDVDADECLLERSLIAGPRPRRRVPAGLGACEGVGSSSLKHNAVDVDPPAGLH
jgi:hypothetical protein